MGWDYKKELVRKIPHFTSIFIIIIYILIGQFSHRIALFLLTLILLILLDLEFFRLDYTKRFRFFSFMEKFRRQKERDHAGGEIFFMLGAIICLAVFDFRVAAAAILMTTFGDITAALVGRRFGAHRIAWTKKTWEGTLAGFAVNLLIGYLFVRSAFDNSLWYLYGSWGSALWPVIIVMAVTASVVELLVEKLDDNLMVPLFAGFNGQIVLLILSIQVVPFS
jgi:phytol kinase